MNFLAGKRIGILTGGGDCPGLNAVIRAATKTAWYQYGATVSGIEDGFEGLVEGRMHEIQDNEVSNILSQGGTVLGSSNVGDLWHYPWEMPDDKIEIHDFSHKAIRNVQRWALDALIAIGGDGTTNISSKLMNHGVNIVGVPKTIDNDLAATDTTFGFDTAVSVVCEAIDRLHTTASSHHRVMVIEIMGRHACWIALTGGAAGGADVILLPELLFSWDALFRIVKERNTRRKRFSIVCVAEGANLPDGGQVVKAMDEKRTDARQLGGIGAVVAQAIEEGGDTGHRPRPSAARRLSNCLRPGAGNELRHRRSPLCLQGRIRRHGRATQQQRGVGPHQGCDRATTHRRARSPAGPLCALRRRQLRHGLGGPWGRAPS